MDHEEARRKNVGGKVLGFFLLDGSLIKKGFWIRVVGYLFLTYIPEVSNERDCTNAIYFVSFLCQFTYRNPNFGRRIGVFLLFFIGPSVCLAKAFNLCTTKAWDFGKSKTHWCSTMSIFWQFMIAKVRMFASFLRFAGGCHTSRLTCGREKNIATACLQGYLAKTYLDEKFGTPEVFGWSHFKLISADSIVFYERE